MVSHSRALARAAIDLASAMVPEGLLPVVVAAAGLDDGGLGTDAARVAEVVGGADGGEGVLVLVDLGSAVLSAEMGLEFCDPEVAGRARLSPAPLVEGLIAAVVAAASGASVEECDARARRALAPKEEHLAGGPARRVEHPPGDASAWSTTVDLPHGLHARPAASVAVALSSLDAFVVLRNARTGAEAVGTSAMELMGLDLRSGDTLEADLSGRETDAARAVLAELAARRFGAG